MTTRVTPKQYARALLNRNGSRRDMTPAEVRATMKDWDPTNFKADTPAPRTKATTATKIDNRSDARAHVKAVAKARAEGIAEVTVEAKKRRRAAEIENARTLARRGQFRATLNTARSAQDAAADAADREADAAEAIAMGKTATTATTTPKTGKALLLQYETMSAGPERIAFWNKNKRAILAAI